MGAQLAHSIGSLQPFRLHFAQHFSRSLGWVPQRHVRLFARRPIGIPGGYNRGQEGYGRSGNGYYAQNRPSQPYRAYASPQNNYARSAPQNYDNRAYENRSFAYNRQPQIAIPTRPQPYARFGGYGSNFYGNPRPEYAVRPATPYTAVPRNDFGQRSYSSEPAFAAPSGRGFAERAPKPEHSGGFHLFGGHHESGRSFGGGHAPKFSGGKHSGGGGGHHFGGGHHR